MRVVHTCLASVDMWYSFAAPPSYAECVLGKVTIQDDADEDAEFRQESYEWAPRYTYYDWSRPPADSANVDLDVK